jgi:TPR repeat protein
LRRAGDGLIQSAQNGGGPPHSPPRGGGERRRGQVEIVGEVVVIFMVAIVLVILLQSAGARGNLVWYAAGYVGLAGILGLFLTRTELGWVSFFWTLLSLLIVWWYFAGWKQVLERPDYVRPNVDEELGWWREWVCQRHLNNDCDFTLPGRGVSADVRGPAILAEPSVLIGWISESHRAFILENKFRSLDITYSNRSSRPLNTDNIFLGLYEFNGPDKRPAEAGTHYLIAGSNGDYDARELYDELDLSQSDRRASINNFIELHKLYGGNGYYRLGQMYLGNNSKPRNDPAYPSAAEPAFLDATAGSYSNVDFIVSDPNNPDYREAYINIHIALLCGETNAVRWQNYIAEVGDLGRPDEQNFQREAADRLQRRGQLTPGGFRDHCAGETFRQRIDMLTQDAVIWRFLNDNRPWPTFDELIKRLALPEVEFREWIGLLVAESVDLYGYNENVYQLYGPRGRYYSYGTQGSEFYRNNPAGGAQGGIDTPARDGLPDECVGLPPGTECPARSSELACRDRADSQLNLGKAYLSAGNVQEARRYLQLATDVGRACQAEGAREAARLLQSLNLTCEYTQDSLARISRDAESNLEGGAVIGLHARQRALAVHGYYEGNIDGKYGPQTRDAVRAFQQAYSFSQTGDLTPIETVYLICSAAEVKDHAPSMNTLGVMYVTGLGVVRNTDAGLAWLKRAEALGDVNAKYNLALIYGTGVAASSYRLCDVPENLQIADAYLVEAANQGHPKAIQWIAKYGALPVPERWAAIKADLVDRRIDADGAEFHERRMTAVGEGCQPNP